MDDRFLNCKKENSEERDCKLLEIGIGNGEFVVFLARKFPECKIFGVEVCRKVLKKAENRVKREGLKNVTLFHKEGIRVLTSFFDEESLDGIYLNFPDPWAKRNQKKRRFINPASVYVILNRLKLGGIFIMVSDFKEYIEEAFSLFLKAGGERISPLWKDYIVNQVPDYYDTKYARKWKKLGFEVYYLGVKKTGKIEIPSWVKEIYPLLKVKGEEALPEVVISVKKEGWEEVKEKLCHVLGEERVLFEERVPSPEGVNLKIKKVVKIFGCYKGKREVLFDLLLVEGELEQRFFMKLCVYKEGTFLLAIHPASSVELTEGIHLAFAVVLREILKNFRDSEIVRHNIKGKIYRKIFEREVKGDDKRRTD